MERRAQAVGTKRAIAVNRPWRLAHHGTHRFADFIIVLLLAVGTALYHCSIARAGSDAVARSIAVEVEGDSTRIRIALDRAVAATVSAMDAPARIVVESPGLVFRLPAWTAGARPRQSGNQSESGGLVTSWRAGRASDAVARLVLEIAEPAIIRKAEVQVREGVAGAELVIEIAPRSPTAPSNAGVAPVGAAPQSTAKLRAGRYEAGPPHRVAENKPVVVIDPGHGGVDPGTVGAGGVLEKTIVLAVAHQLRAALLALGRYQVAMTRAGDDFVALDARVDLAETIGADLFVSLHADAIEDRAMAGAIRGASVYVLSSRASDEEARRLAERENSADARAGGGITKARGEPDVRGILADLMRREREEFSLRARTAVIDELGRRIKLNSKPARAASLRVLRQPRTPAVLVELGYMSNRADQQLLMRADWQQRVATGLAAAIDRYFEGRDRRRR